MSIEIQNPSSPCVGIIIPIYNVEPYLRECLDSVINQTYQNLQIVLVDDGSTDNSFAIATEYFEKDERIVLIKKENRGLSHTRNIGLDYLSNFLKKKGGEGGEIQILEHSSPKKVEYIHFLDSDDWLELDCIEKCVWIALSSGAEIVWHDFKVFNEYTKQTAHNTFLKDLNLKDNELLSGLQIFKKLKYPSFSWTWPGLIKAKIIRDTRFELNIESEDAIFGMQLFALNHKIVVLCKELMFYRVRPNSISQHTLMAKGDNKNAFPLCQQDLVQAFDGHVYTIRHYSFAYSCAIICLRMDEFLKKQNNLSNELREILKTMIEVRAIYAFGGCGFEKDPRNVREICSKLLDYTGKIRWGSRLAYYYPRIFKIFKKLDPKRYNKKFILN